MIKKIPWFAQKHEKAQLFSALIIIILFLAPSNHIKMITEGSCDTEDQSND